MVDKNLDKDDNEVEEPITEYSRLDQNGIYTYWDYLKWQFEERVELIRGKIFKMSPAPNANHQRVNINLSRLAMNIFWNNPCQVFQAPFDVRLPIPTAKRDTTVVQPDLCIICDLKKIADGRACNGAPDLVVEILSPGNSTHEIKTKFELYEESGVKEYWIIYPAERSIVIYKLENYKFIGLPPFSEGMTIHSSLFTDLKIEVEDIFHKVD